MTKKGFGILLLVSLLLSVGIVGIGGYKKITGKSIVSTTSVTSSSDTLPCGHKSFWLTTDENGNTYCQSCNIDERLSMTLPKF